MTPKCATTIITGLLLLSSAVLKGQSSCSAPYDVNNPVIFSSPDAAKQHIVNYRNKHKKKDSTHTKSVFIGKENFLFIKKFLTDNPDAYSGIRIHFAAYGERKAPGQQDDKAITVFFTPALQDKTSDYDAMRNYKTRQEDGGFIFDFDGDLDRTKGSVNHGELCPSHCDDETDDYGEDPPPPPPGGGLLVATQSQIDDAAKRPLVGPRNQIVLLTRSEALQYKKVYRRRFCKLGNKKHTRSIFLKKENFIFIGDFFKANKAYDGIRIYFASYDNRLLAEQKRDEEITVVMAPTKIKEPDFCAFIRYFNSRSEAANAKLKEGYQVEICQKNCPDGERPR